MNTPISGDHKNYQFVISTDKPLDLMVGVKFVSSSKCGAINTFSGTIRDTDLKTNKETLPIVAIHYEAYESMAIKQISDIIITTINNPNNLELFDCNSRAYVAIRLGRVPVNEASIIICVSSTSRYCSHKATMVILEKIKSVATIWKKAIFSDGSEEWVPIEKSEAIWLKDNSF